MRRGLAAVGSPEVSAPPPRKWLRVDAPERAACILSRDDLTRILSSAESCKIRALVQDADPQTDRAVLELCQELATEQSINAGLHRRRVPCLR